MFMKGLRKIVLGIGGIVLLGLSSCQNYDNITQQGLAEESQKTQIIQRQFDMRTEQEAYENSDIVNTTRRIGEERTTENRPSYYRNR